MSRDQIELPPESNTIRIAPNVVCEVLLGDWAVLSFVTAMSLAQVTA
jgi:hypothetical protein